jgi:hypothetical protein
VGARVEVEVMARVEAAVAAVAVTEEQAAVEIVQVVKEEVAVVEEVVVVVVMVAVEEEVVVGWVAVGTSLLVPQQEPAMTSYREHRFVDYFSHRSALSHSKCYFPEVRSLRQYLHWETILSKRV